MDGEWETVYRNSDLSRRAQNDMIFSIVCEELGLVGAALIILLFLLLIWRFFVIAVHAQDLFGALIASGAMAHMMIQVILNIAVVTNTIPNTGITLSVYQLWRDVGSVSFDGNGTCAECVQSDTIKRTSGAEGRDGNKVVRRIG